MTVAEMVTTGTDALIEAAHAAGPADRPAWLTLAAALDRDGAPAAARRARAVAAFDRERVRRDAPPGLQAFRPGVAEPTARLAAYLAQDLFAGWFGRGPWDEPAVDAARRKGLHFALGLAVNGAGEAWHDATRAAWAADRQGPQFAAKSAAHLADSVPPAAGLEWGGAAAAHDACLALADAPRWREGVFGRGPTAGPDAVACDSAAGSVLLQLQQLLGEHSGPWTVEGVGPVA